MILKEGFRDGVDNHGWGIVGVWVSDYPLGCGEGCKGDHLIGIDCRLSDEVLDFHEIKEDDKPYREWLIPAALLNANCDLRVADRDEASAA